MTDTATGPWIIAACIVAWMACSVGAYLLGRHDYRKTFSTWTVRDRRFMVTFAVVMGPIAFLALFATWLEKRDFKILGDGDKPANW